MKRLILLIASIEDIWRFIITYLLNSNLFWNTNDQSFFCIAFFILQRKPGLSAPKSGQHIQADIIAIGSNIGKRRPFDGQTGWNNRGICPKISPTENNPSSKERRTRKSTKWRFEILLVWFSGPYGYWWYFETGSFWKADKDFSGASGIGCGRRLDRRIWRRYLKGDFYS